MLWWLSTPYWLAGLGFVFPEVKSASGMFDILGSSHQIWHVLIFLGELMLL